MPLLCYITMPTAKTLNTSLKCTHCSLLSIQRNHQGNTNNLQFYHLDTLVALKLGQGQMGMAKRPGYMDKFKRYFLHRLCKNAGIGYPQNTNVALKLGQGQTDTNIDKQGSYHHDRLQGNL